LNEEHKGWPSSLYKILHFPVSSSSAGTLNIHSLHCS
jgi:hypothetical protein